MITLTIINSIVSFGIFIFFIYKFLLSRIYLDYARTFWSKKIYGINIMWITSGSRYNVYSAEGIFYIPIRNREKCIAKDNQQKLKK